ncbi:hypothetical protein Glove_121g33 [Diversispora epigaea]|uniref:Uncharacterized protein n=1 Tax=Diversispora epigaea TaxID=1348612 RepID=A0A397IZ69_9GLOM|nr:hypothetical protein Glove_121g33 [Diversispora epigaea]
MNSLTFEEFAFIRYEEPASREPEFETDESKSKSDETESESDKTDNESDESEESESAEEETETIPKFSNNTYSDLMTLIIQHNLNNKAGNAIIRFFNKHSNLPISPLPKNIEQGRKLMDRMKLINLLNKKKVILKYNNKDYIIYYRPIINCIKNILSTFNFKNDQRRNKPDIKQLLAYLPIIKAKDDTQKISEEHKNIVCRTFHKSLKFLLSLNQIEPRSHNNMKLYYKNNTGKNVSIENVRNFFWSVLNINIYATIPDRMHHLDLGLFQHQLNFTKILINKQCGKSVINEMNRRITKISYYKDLKSFPNGFLHLTLLTASEYQSLMKIMIFIVDELYEDSRSPNFIKNNKITKVYLKWNKMYLLSRKENYEESNVTLLQESINEWAKLFIELFKEHSKSELQFSKLHSWVFHICSSIREFGTINGYTTETYESLHKDYVKKPYKLTNKKEIEKQIMKIIRCKAIITESSSKEIPKTPIALKYSKKLYEFCIQNAEIYIQTRMNDPDLEKEMKLGFEKFLECLDESINEWAKLFIELFKEHSKSELQFSKLHSWVFHICSSIREFGTINGYTTETYESLHKDYVKKPYKLTNKKEIEKQIMKIIRCKAIITESSSKEIPKTPIALKYSKKLYEFCIQNAEIYIQTRMNDPDLEKEMKLGFEKFLECLDVYLEIYYQKLSEHEKIDMIFHIYGGVILKFGSIMRTTNKFHKKPIFSNIAVEMNADEIFEYTSDNGICFAQVLLIIEIIMNYEEPMHLALVQWYDFTSLLNACLFENHVLNKVNQKCQIKLLIVMSLDFNNYPSEV